MQYETKEITYGNIILSVNRPILTEEERKHRENNIKTALRIIGRKGQYESQKTEEVQRSNSGY